MCREEELQSVRSAYLADPIPGLAGFCSSSVMLEFMRNDADKGTGLAALAARLGIAREEVIAIGDGENDIPMLRWAGLGVAMANAPDDVKAAADLIAPHCDEDGCAQIMEKYLLNE